MGRVGVVLYMYTDSVSILRNDYLPKVIEAGNEPYHCSVLVCTSPKLMYDHNLCGCNPFDYLTIYKCKTSNISELNV